MGLEKQDLGGRRLYKAENLDLIEKYIFSAVFAVFTYRMIGAYIATGSPITLIYLADQFLVLAFMLFRRSTRDVSIRLNDWIIGVAGTTLAVMIGPPGDTPLAPPAVAVGLMLTGYFIHLSAKLSLRRSFGVVAANRGVKSSGAYRIVRHPMYLGYFVSQVGILLAGPTWPNVVIIGLCWTLSLRRIVAEERLLMQDPAYQAFALTTRYRLFPGIY